MPGELQRDQHPLHARRPVRFHDAVRAVAARGCTAVVEIGPHPVLVGGAEATFKNLDADVVIVGSGVAGGRRKRRDLGDIARTWKADKAVAAALADQDRVDEDLWR